MLDRLIKDIVSESASTFVSILQTPDEKVVTQKDERGGSSESSLELTPAFSLTNFIPLLQERIYVINPFTRTFLVSWVTLLDTIPDLELVAHLPAFLGGLIKFLNDPNRDVHITTQGALERFLNEIKKIAKIKRGIAEGRRSLAKGKLKHANSSDRDSVQTDQSTKSERSENAEGDAEEDDSRGNADDYWVPGQDVRVDHTRILEILVTFLDPSSGG